MQTTRESSASDIEILLATYNAGPYLKAQIDSLLAQTYPHWRLLVHDDGSTDGTQEIINCYVSRFPDKITWINDGIRKGSAKDNFSHLMGMAQSAYVAFCDQDDVWCPDKLQLSIDLLQNREAEVGAAKPLLVFTDLMVVDSELNCLAPSFWAYQSIPPTLANSLNQLAVRNCVTGCTVLMNRAALQVSLPVPQKIYMHDWWCGLSVLAGNGELIAFPEATVCYRQHDKNAVGASAGGVKEVARKLIGFKRFLSDLSAKYALAHYFFPHWGWFRFMWIKMRVWFSSRKL